MQNCEKTVSGKHQWERTKNYQPSIGGVAAAWIASQPFCRHCGIVDDTKDDIFVSGEPGEVDKKFIELLKTKE